jgi:hypothetical protein
VVRGRKARVEIRQGAEQKWKPELYVVPVRPQGRPGLLLAVTKRVAALRERHPGLSVDDSGADLRLVIPDALRTSHEAHFAEVTSRFLEYLNKPASLPQWEKANMLAKYTITTRGAELSLRAR